MLAGDYIKSYYLSKMIIRCRVAVSYLEIYVSLTEVEIKVDPCIAGRFSGIGFITEIN